MYKRAEYLMIKKMFSSINGFDCRGAEVCTAISSEKGERYCRNVSQGFDGVFLVVFGKRIESPFLSENNFVLVCVS